MGIHAWPAAIHGNSSNPSGSDVSDSSLRRQCRCLLRCCGRRATTNPDGYLPCSVILVTLLSGFLPFQDENIIQGLRIGSIPMTSQLKSSDFLRHWLRLKKESWQRMELERKIIRKRVLRRKEVLRSSCKLKDAPRLSLDSSGSACSGDLPMLRRSPYAAHRSTRQQQQSSHNQQQQLQQHAFTSQQSQSSNPHLPRLRTEIPH